MMVQDTADTWITEMTIFLSTGLPPEGMRPEHFVVGTYASSKKQ